MARRGGITLKTFFLFLGLAGVAGSMHASPILYNFNFTGGTPNATGSFDYDPLATTNPFASFVVAISGDTFDFTSLANGETGIGCGGTTGPQSLFNGLTGIGSGCGAGVQQWSAILAGPDGEGFNLLNSTFTNLTLINFAVPNQVHTFGTFTTSAVPEPGTTSMFLAGAGALWAWKRRRAI
jgi:hypothetical protein